MVIRFFLFLISKRRKDIAHFISFSLSPEYDFGQQNNLILESQGYFVIFYILSEIHTRYTHTHTQVHMRYG